MPSVGRWVVLACLIVGCGARTELYSQSHPAPGVDGGVVADSLAVLVNGTPRVRVNSSPKPSQEVTE